MPWWKLIWLCCTASRSVVLLRQSELVILWFSSSHDKIARLNTFTPDRAKSKLFDKIEQHHSKVTAQQFSIEWSHFRVLPIETKVESQESLTTKDETTLTKPCSVTILWKATEQYFHVVLFVL